MYRCENCGKQYLISKEIDYASTRFCSISCARSFSSKNVNHSSTKLSKCINCGKEIYIKINSSHKTAKCDFCRRLSFCPICGRLKNNPSSNCNNSFCLEHNPQHFRNLIKYFGFNESKYGTEEVENEFNRVRQELYGLYWDQGLSSTEIALRYNYQGGSSNITQKFFKKYLNIPIKDQSYSVKENYTKGRTRIAELSETNNYPYKHGKHITWNNKEVYFRSQYELDYALELDLKRVDYDMECLRIKYFDTKTQSYRCSIPDFYIPSQNLIVEIKSSYTLDVQNMRDRFIEYRNQGYNCKCICDYVEIEI